MKAFITGATGFIGSHLARKLLKEGHQVCCLVRSAAKADQLHKWGAEIIISTLLNPHNLVEIIGTANTVFHVAGVTKSVDSAGYFAGNHEITEKLLAIITRYAPDDQKLIYISSQAAAGPSLSSNFFEKEKDANPVSAYGRSKLAAEQLILDSTRQQNSVILRPSIVFGPRDREMLTLFKAARSGIIPHAGFRDFPANFIYIDDLIQAILLVANRETANGKTYFVHDGKPSSWKIMNKILAEQLNSKAIIVPILLPILHAVCAICGMAGKIRQSPTYMNLDKWQEIKQAGWLCSSKHIEKELGFTPRWTLRSAVAKTAQWYRQNGWLS